MSAASITTYRLAYQNVLVPLHGILKNRRYSQHLRFLEESQWWSTERLLEFQWQELLRLLEHAFRSVPYYQEKYRKAGIALADIRTREDFAQLPTLTSAEINANRERLCSADYHGKLLPHTTGGSTGTPMRFFRTIESYDWRTAAKDRVYSWSGWSPGERTVHLWGAPVGHVSKHVAVKTRAHQWFQRQLVINTLSQTDRLWEDVHRRIEQFRPKVIVGYVSSLVEFSSYLKRRNLQIPHIEGVITAAEPLYGSTRVQIQEGLGAPVFNTYGSREFMSLAGECERHDGLHVNVENVLIETKLPPDAGPSEVLVTDLHNFGMPFIRYSLGDLAVLDESTCRCGRGLPRIQRIDGRLLDALRTPEGRTIPGEFFVHMLKDIPEVARYRVEQVSAERIVIFAVLHSAVSERSRTEIGAAMIKAFGDRMRWEIRPVAEIPQLASGKRRITVGMS